MTIPGYILPIGETDPAKISRSVRNLYEYLTGLDLENVLASKAPLSKLGAGCGRYSYVSPTLTTFACYNGNQIKINGTWYNIPTAGVSAGNTSVFVDGSVGNLAVNTTYLVTLFNNAGTPTIDFKTTVTHAADTTAGNEGVEIYDSAHSVIGLIHTNGLAQFQDDAANRLVISWFNRRDRPLMGATTNGATTTATATWVELTTASRVNLVQWAEEGTWLVMGGFSSNDTSMMQSYASIGQNVVSVGQPSYTTSPMAFGWEGVCAVYAANLGSDGYVVYTPMAFVGGGTGYFYLTLTGHVRG